MAITIKCHGTYYFKTEKDKGIRPFEEVVRAPSMKYFNETFIKLQGTDENGKLKFSETTFPNVRGRIKKKLLPAILERHQDKYPNFVRVRGVVIDEITTDNNERLDLPVNLMSIKQIGQLLQDRHIPIDIHAYMDVDELRSDVMEYQDDPDTFQKNRARKDQRRAEEREFLALNDLLPKDQPKVGNPKGKGISGLE